VDRDKTPKLKKLLEYELAHRRAVRINLYHAPGAGGTTMAYRILWDFHTRYPCAVLVDCHPEETAERLFRLCSWTGLPALVLVDGARIAEREVDGLFDQMRGRQLPVVLLQTLRRFKPQEERERAHYLSAELTPPEVNRFIHAFSTYAPAKRKDLEELSRAPDARMRSAFYFGLRTFGRDFLGIGSYVGVRLAGLSADQVRVLGYLAIAHHYAQRSLPAQAFVPLVGIPASRTVQLRSAFPEETLDLLTEERAGQWRTAHDLLAQELLEQLLWPSAGEDRARLWRQNLSTWAIAFAQFCRGDTSRPPSEEMLEVARRTFIYRDNTELLGTERSGGKSFAQLIEEIPSEAGQLETLRVLADLYPREAHIWAHLGRFHSMQRHDYPKP
jgi:hypothetical protein